MSKENTMNEVNINDPRFEKVWQAIKEWDIQRRDGDGYANATGTDVQTILDALDEGSDNES